MTTLLIPTGQGIPMHDRVAQLCDGLDFINTSGPRTHMGTRYVEVDFGGNPRDTDLAIERLKKIGGLVLGSPPSPE